MDNKGENTTQKKDNSQETSTEIKAGTTKTTAETTVTTTTTAGSSNPVVIIENATLSTFDICALYYEQYNTLEFEVDSTTTQSNPQEDR